MKITPITKNGKRQWRLNFMANGKQHRRFFPTQEAAILYGNTVKQEKTTHGGAWLAVPAKDRAEILKALEKAKEEGCQLVEAIAAWREMKSLKAQNFSTRLLTAIDQCLESKRHQNLRTRYLQQFGVTMRHLKKAFGDADLNEISTASIEKWLTSNEWAPATRKSYRMDVQTFFSFCRGRGWITVNPVMAVPVPILDDRPPSILTVEQAEALMKAAKLVDPDLCGWISLCLFAGVRPEEARRLVPSEVDLNSCLVEIKALKSKTRARRLVMLSQNCVEWCKIGLELPVINWRKRFEKVRQKAGLLEDWEQDCMRHSCASYHLALHGSADRTSTELGHRSTEMLFSNYRELVRPEAAKRFFEIVP